MQLYGSLSILWHCLSLGLEWKLTFPSPVVTAEFSKCWHIEFSTFTASSFRIWKSSTGIPSPPLALLGVVLPKAQWTYHSRMSGSRWVITASWLSGSWKFFFFLVYFCVFLPPLLNTLCFCWVLSISVLYWAHLCMKYSLGISKFLEEISSLSHSIVSFISLHWSLRKILSLWATFWTLHASEYIFPFLLCLLLLFFSQLLVRPPQTTVLPFCISFPWGWSCSLPPIECHELPSIVLQALYLSDLIPWIYLSLPLYNHKGFDLGHTWMVQWFSLLSSI